MKNWAERKSFSHFRENYLWIFTQRTCKYIQKKTKTLAEAHKFLQKWAILYFPWRMLHKETKIVTNIKTTCFFVQEFAGHEMSDFFITYTCAKFVVKTPIFSKIFTETTFFTKTDYFRAKPKCLDNFRGNGKRLFRFKPNYILVVHYYGFFEE